MGNIIIFGAYQRVVVSRHSYLLSKLVIPPPLLPLSSRPLNDCLPLLRLPPRLQNGSNLPAMLLLEFELLVLANPRLLVSKRQFAYSGGCHSSLAQTVAML